MRTITARRSLFPPSSARTSNSSPCGSPAQWADVRVYQVHIPAPKTDLGSNCPPEVELTSCSPTRREHLTSYHFGHSLSASFGCLQVTTVHLLVHIYYPCRSSLAPQPPAAGSLQF